MPAEDLYHETVKQALVKDGWEITHDPLLLKMGRKSMYVDLGAEEVLAAEKAGRKIAVEIKSFIGPSEMHDLHTALGQFLIYRDVLKIEEPGRDLYLAVREKVYYDLFEEPIGELVLKNYRVRLLVFNAETEEIVQWKPEIATERS